MTTLNCDVYVIETPERNPETNEFSFNPLYVVTGGWHPLEDLNFENSEMDTHCDSIELLADEIYQIYMKREGEKNLYIQTSSGSRSNDTGIKVDMCSDQGDLCGKVLFRPFDISEMRILIQRIYEIAKGELVVREGSRKNYALNFKL